MPSSTAPDGVPSSGDASQAPLPPPSPVPVLMQQYQFKTSRAAFTHFAKSGGNDRRSLGRAIANYISSSPGGSRQSARRMGSSLVASARLVGFLSDVMSRGAREALKALHFEELVGRPIEEIFLGLADYVCIEGGTVDEGIARNAFIETIAELAEAGITDINALTIDQMQTVMEIFATHAIEGRLCNDIGTKITIAPTNIAAFDHVYIMLHDFILRGVSDALSHARSGLQSLTPTRSLEFVQHIYERAFSILETLAEREASS